MLQWPTPEQRQYHAKRDAEPNFHLLLREIEGDTTQHKRILVRIKQKGLKAMKGGEESMLSERSHNLKGCTHYFSDMAF